MTIVCMTTTMICNIMIPLNTEFIGLIATFMVNGFVGGLAGSGANLYLIQLWGKENPPFLQALHFCYGLGALIAPLIAKPFLLPVEPEQGLDVVLNDTSIHENVMQYTPADVMLIYPYGIVAALHLIPICFFIVLYRLHPITDEHPSRAVILVDVPLDADSEKAIPDSDQKEEQQLPSDKQELEQGQQQ